MPDEIPHITRRRGKRNRPNENAWHQQRMPAKRPAYTVRTAAPILIVLGVAMFTLGINSYFAVDNSLELEVEYTKCSTLNGTGAHVLLAEAITNGTTNGTAQPAPIQCEFKFQLNETWGKDGKEVKFYYKLNGFYQNFRLYLSSRDDLQLSGSFERQSIKDCEPYEQYGRNSSFPIIPCGLIANSMFNDTFAMYYNSNINGTEELVRVPFTAMNLMNKQEIKRKFKNPMSWTDNQTDLCNSFAKFNAARPKSWQKDACQLGWDSKDDEMIEDLSPQEQLDEKQAVGQGLQFIDFMIWMKPAALPSFRKIYRKLNQNGTRFSGGLQPGTYTVLVNYNYPVVDYKIRKFFVLTQESWMGPKNYFLPIIYMVTGSFCLLVGLIFCGACLCKRILIRPVTDEPPVIRM